CILLLPLRRHPRTTLFPYTTLFRSSYGFGENVDYRAQDVTLEDFASVFSVFRCGEKLGEARLNVPGQHNVQNAIGVVALASELRSEEHTSELQSRGHLVCRPLLEKK